MMLPRFGRGIGLTLVLVATAGLGGCGWIPGRSVEATDTAKTVKVSEAERDCLVRAMYFEANRSSDEGLLAVGSVVMNRVESGRFPGTICGVVGQPRQFAQGVLTRPMSPRDEPRVAAVADAVLAGERHPKIADAMYFHMATRRYHYNNMRYVLVAGGNAFYEKTPSLRLAMAAPVSAANPLRLSLDRARTFSTKPLVLAMYMDQGRNRPDPR